MGLKPADLNRCEIGQLKDARSGYARNNDLDEVCGIALQPAFRPVAFEMDGDLLFSPLLFAFEVVDVVTGRSRRNRHEQGGLRSVGQQFVIRFEEIGSVEIEIPQGFVHCYSSRP